MRSAHLPPSPPRRARTPPFRMLAVLLLAVVASLPLALLPAAPASAAAAFTNATFAGVNQITLTGSKDVGSTLEIRRSGSGGIFCDVTNAASTSWSCPTVTVPNGQYTFTGVETLDDSSTQEMSPVTVTVVGPPRLDGAPGSTLTTGRFTGSGEPGADLRILSSGPGGDLQHACPDVLGDGFWSCIINVPSGEYAIRAIQSMPAFDSRFSSASSTLSATIDRDPPAAPTVSEPVNGTVSEQRQVDVSGVGEAGASIQVFVNSEQRCVIAPESDGSFRCTVDLGSPGSSTIQVLQRDAAGNFSAPSPRIEVEYAPPPATPGPAPNAPAPESPAPAPEEPTDPEDPETLTPDPDSDNESATPAPPSPTPTRCSAATARRSRTHGREPSTGARSPASAARYPPSTQIFERAGSRSHPSWARLPALHRSAHARLCSQLPAPPPPRDPSPDRPQSGRHPRIGCDPVSPPLDHGRRRLRRRGARRRTLRGHRTRGALPAVHGRDRARAARATQRSGRPPPRETGRDAALASP